MADNFYAVLSRMKYIKRWGLMRSTREENLSEHTLETALIAHSLALIGNRRLGKNYDAGQIVLTALYHDATEIITGDLPTPVKYYNTEIKDVYKNIESVAGNRLLKMLPEDLREDYSPLIHSENSEYHTLIKAADKLSAYIKCIEEENMGNKEFSVAASSTEKAIKDLKCEEADIFLKEFIPAYRLTLDEQA